MVCNKMYKINIVKMYKINTLLDNKVATKHLDFFMNHLFLAKCISALVMACPSECDLIVRQFMMDVQNQKSTDSIRTFVLLSLGEIGQNIDLTIFKELETVYHILNCTIFLIRIYTYKADTISYLSQLLL